MNIEQLKTALLEGAVEIVFTKVDGELRTMLATLCEPHMPPQKPSTTPREPNPELLAVWDMQKEGWRSMRIDNIITAGGETFEK